MDYPSYPGHKATDPYTFKHQLVLITRAIIIQRSSGSLLRSWREGLIRFAGDPCATVPPPWLTVPLFAPAPKGVRIFAPKVLAVPEKLSQGKYAALATALALSTRMGFPVPIVSLEQEAVVECWLQAEACPQLLDYTGDE